MPRLALVAVSLLCPPLCATPAAPSAGAPARINYLLNCGGCHGEQGASNSHRVPELRAQVGYFLNLPEGRDYVARLPNVAFAALGDQELADVLNFTVFVLGRGSVPADAHRYSAAEVARLRRRPLNEVSLNGVRRRLVDELVGRFGAPQRLRLYAGDPD